MNMFSTTAIFAGILGLMLVMLSARISLIRNKLKVALGTAKDNELERAVRAQANFVEYAPLFLILLFLLEIQEMPNWILVCIGSVFVFARISHAFAISYMELRDLKKGLKFRVLGTALTYTLISIMSLALVLKNL